MYWVLYAVAWVLVLMVGRVASRVKIPMRHLASAKLTWIIDSIALRDKLATES